MSIQQIFAKGQPIWESLYRLEIRPEPFESELFQSAPLRRLKHLHHFGAGAFISPVRHSRFEHTVGVWALAKHFFPQWLELHAAAILHDIGHLPFSHSIERSLGLDHHAVTEQAILGEPIASILRRHGLSEQRTVDLLNQDSPLTHRSDLIGIDHLDSFLRDTQAAGKNSLDPAELVRRLRFRDHYAETDEETAMHLLNAVAGDNLIFLSPYFLAADALLGQASAVHLDAHPELRVHIPSMTDYQLTVQLENSPSAAVRDMMRVLLYEPHRIVPCGDEVPDALRADIRKVYMKQPLVGGVPIRELNPEARARLEELEALKGSHYFQVI
ncbi:HD domain-containing protein [Paenibacillus filicis]|uniref:HD domain-containing protein n=1 Tax=Paenibacillus gyeongsangnamensis TaxID=3388067 RepID=A0ABT4QCL2_9BACL|nr:HD domain-containing protein [Paenibacillus filicis]MCZ8514507.1 HD domain-containing protein [Paenibacillus filicis]